MGIKSILLFVSMAAISYNQIMVAAEVAVTTTNSGLEKIKVLDDLDKKNCGKSTPATKTGCCKKFIADYTSTNGDNEKIKFLCTAFKKTDNTDYNGCTDENKEAINTKPCNMENLKPPSKQALSEKGRCLKSAFDKLNNIGPNCQKEHHNELKELITENKRFSHCDNFKTKFGTTQKCTEAEKTNLKTAVCELTNKAATEKKKFINTIKEAASTTNCKFLVTGAMTTWYDIENICNIVKTTQLTLFKKACNDEEYDKVKDAACSLKFESCSGGANAVFSGLLTIFVSLVAALFTKS